MQRPRWLSGLDASFLHLESATQPLQVISVLELDVSTIPGGYDYSRFRHDLSMRVRGMPAFLEKPSHGLAYLGRPVWLADGAIDVDRHVHRVVLPAPAGRAELVDVCSYLAGLPLSRDRPLWEMWVIEGGHRLAVLIKVHHAEADGVTFARMLSQLCSTEIDPEPNPRLRIRRSARVRGRSPSTDWHVSPDDPCTSPSRCCPRPSGRSPTPFGGR